MRSFVRSGAVDPSATPQADLVCFVASKLGAGDEGQGSLSTLYVGDGSGFDAFESRDAYKDAHKAALLKAMRFALGERDWHPPVTGSPPVTAFLMVEVGENREEVGAFARAGLVAGGFGAVPCSWEHERRGCPAAAGSCRKPALAFPGFAVLRAPPRAFTPRIPTAKHAKSAARPDPRRLNPRLCTARVLRMLSSDETRCDAPGPPVARVFGRAQGLGGRLNRSRRPIRGLPPLEAREAWPGC